MTLSQPPESYGTIFRSVANWTMKCSSHRVRQANPCWHRNFQLTQGVVVVRGRDEEVTGLPLTLGLGVIPRHGGCPRLVAGVADVRPPVIHVTQTDISWSANTETVTLLLATFQCYSELKPGVVYIWVSQPSAWCVHNSESNGEALLGHPVVITIKVTAVMRMIVLFPPFHKYTKVKVVRCILMSCILYSFYILYVSRSEDILTRD